MIVAMETAASAIGHPVGIGLPGTALRGTGGMMAAQAFTTLPNATVRPGTAGSTAGIAAAVEVLWLVAAGGNIVWPLRSALRAVPL